MRVLVFVTPVDAAVGARGRHARRDGHHGVRRAHEVSNWRWTGHNTERGADRTADVRASERRVEPSLGALKSHLEFLRHRLLRGLDAWCGRFDGGVQGWPRDGYVRLCSSRYSIRGRWRSVT